MKDFPMKLLFGLFLCLASSGCVLVAVPVAAAGAVAVTTVKTTGAIVTAPFDDDDEDEDEEREKKESRREKRNLEEVRRVETYYAEPARHVYPAPYGHPDLYPAR
ncbi:MAG: hypothetical protein ACO1TE_07685 [Prosthecobacter sp.]